MMGGEYCEVSNLYFNGVLFLPFCRISLGQRLLTPEELTELSLAVHLERKDSGRPFGSCLLCTLARDLKMVHFLK